MEAIKKLKEVSLISKVMKELELNTGLKREKEDEKQHLNILTHFIIDLCDKSNNLDEFIKKLNDSDSDFPLSLIQNLFNMIKEVKGKNTDRSQGNKNNINNINN